MSSDPKYIGPGYWASFHIKSSQADTYEKKSETARSIAIDIVNFPCLNCRNHAKDYVRNNPLLPAVRDNKDKLSLFKWTVDFHNAVNLRLGKPMINWEKAEKLWSGENVCVGDCGFEEESESNIEKEESEEKENDIIIKVF